MNRGLDASAIEALFLAACRAELSALKPGNVHVHGAGHGMDVDLFEKSAIASAPHISAPGLAAGLRIRRAVEASFAAAGCNTNLGIVLLCAPLACAAERDAAHLRDALGPVLAALDLDDAANAFAAIALANPAGLGRVETGDVAATATVTLLEAMRLAADRDRIARAYTDGFEDIFTFGLPRLTEARKIAHKDDDATTSLHMAYLTTYLDSHILRKFGEQKARDVRKRAQVLAAAARPPISDNSRYRLLEFDQDLKTEGINPGTTADFVVATLFAATIISSAPASHRR